MVGEIRALTFDDETEIVELIRVCVFNGDNLHIGELVPNDSNVYNIRIKTKTLVTNH